MQSSLVFLLALIITGLRPVPPAAQTAEQPNAEAVAASSPEISRLWRTFGGDWNTTEEMERSEFFLKGGARSGNSHWKLAVGGTLVIDEGHSDGSAGPLDHFLAFWWDKDAKLYRLFVCFKDQGGACQLRGTANWQGNDFVNDYDEVVAGKSTKMRDSFTEITPNSYTLIAAIDSGKGRMQTLITTRSVRQKGQQAVNP